MRKQMYVDKNTFFTINAVNKVIALIAMKDTPHDIYKSRRTSVLRYRIAAE